MGNTEKEIDENLKLIKDLANTIVSLANSIEKLSRASLSHSDAIKELARRVKLLEEK